MSSYSTSRVTMTPEARIMQQIAASGCTFFDLARPVIGSVELSGHAAALRTADTVAALQAGWATLSATPGALDALEQAAPIELSAFTSLCSRAETLGGSAGGTDERMATSHLSTALDRTVDLLRADERELTSAVLTSALTDLGYTVNSACGDHVNGIAAYQGDLVLVALISDGGAAEIDTAGLTGDDCAEPLAALDATLRARGVELHIERRVDHGDSGGGTLIRRAAAANADDLAAGLIATVEPHRRSAPRRRAAQRRAQAVGGGA